MAKVDASQLPSAQMESADAIAFILGGVPVSPFEESNVFVNPRHADAAKLRSWTVRRWFFDERRKR